jgi:hypothetical protein
LRKLRCCPWRAGQLVKAIHVPTRPQATATENLVNRLRDDVLSKEHATSYVTGTTAGTVDFTERITPRWLEPIVPYLQLEGSTAPAASEPVGPAETEMAAETETASAAPRRPSAE